MIKSTLFKVCSIACYTFFPSFGEFMNTTPVKSFSFAANHSSSHFSHLRMNQSTAQQVRDPSMQTSANRKELSLVGKLHWVELPNWVLPWVSKRFCRMWWTIVMKKNNFVLTLTVRPFSCHFQARNGSNQSIVVDRFDWFSINHFLRF